VVFYCSKVCQKKHFPAHKHSCKTIANAYAALAKEQKLADLQANGEIGHDVYDPVNQVRQDIGNMTFQLAYRSCDTPRRGGAMLEVALDHFLELLRLKSPVIIYWREEDVCAQRPNYALLTRIVALLVALDRDDDAFNMIDYFKRAVENDSTDILDVVEGSGYSRFHPVECIGYRYRGPGYPEVYENARSRTQNWDRTVMVCLILIKMRVLVEHRSDRRGLERFVRTSEGGRLAEVHCTIEKYLLWNDSMVSEFDADIRTLLSYICDFDPLLMNHIRDTVPLSPEAADCLFEPEAPTEFWHLLQDCFFLSPGVNDVLHDYVPDLPFDLET
jgi:hypothetical protein